MEIAVDTLLAGQRVDQLLAGIPQVGTRSFAEKLIRQGAVAVNGSAMPKSHRVHKGDVVTVDDDALPAATAPPLAAVSDVPVVFEDEYVLVVDKPAGLVVHPAPGYRQPTLVEKLTAAGVELSPSDDERFQRPGVVHRLDKDTSGLMILAKVRPALVALQAALRDRRIHREYLALVDGRVPSRSGRIEAPIGPDVRDASKRSIDTNAPQEAVTHFRVSELLADATLVNAWLETGRTHQIRVHFAAIGHSVVGDGTYGGSRRFGAARQFLHSTSLSFPHPVYGDEVQTAAALPDDLHDVLAAARSAAADPRGG